ncbi:MAG TPA: hypothetical protein VHP33_13135 [Polyangiaceae bacterium]|nr:hypothetical protein [Polyangiaceae bacterium]
MPREVRPRFEIRREEPAGPLLERVSLRLRARECPLCGFVADDRIALYVRPSRQRLWSPELRVDVTQQGEVTVLQGMYAPHPHVWITYVAVLAIVVVGLVSAVTFALVEASMNQRPVALYALLPLLAIGGAAYALAFVGQGFAADEMDELRAFLDDALDAGGALSSHIRNLRPSGAESSSSSQLG